MPFKTFMSTLMAAAVALTSISAAPARADNDTAKIIAGAAALAIIGMAVADSNDDRHVARQGYYPRQNRHLRQRHYARQQQYIRQQHRNRHWHKHHRHRRDCHHRHRNNRRHW